MIVADRWQDYELIDAGGGEKYERWGTYRLVRPDPQAIWPHEPWKRFDARYIRSDKGGGHWQYQHELPKSWLIEYPGLAGLLRFQVEPTGFKHTGLFPEQAANWDYLGARIQKARAQGRQYKVLNLFAYTGAATVAAAVAGASDVVHVDAAKGMNQRAKENLRLSGQEGSHIHVLTDDVLKFVAREIRRGHRYEAIILDPPSYGRGPGGELWKLEERLYPLLAELQQLLNYDEAEACVVLNAYTTGLAASVLQNMLTLTFGQSCPRGRAYADELGLPMTARKLYLPCGSTAHFEVQA